MAEFDWNDEKNAWVLKTRGVGFEDVVFHIHSDGVLDVIRHPNRKRYPNQNIILVDIDGYVHLVPYVKQEGVRFLKTIIPSRKATREYLR